MKRGMIALIFFGLTLSGFGAIDNIAKIEELSESSTLDTCTYILSDELPISCLRVSETLDPDNIDLLEAERDPTPNLPSPVPSVDVAATRDQIEGITGDSPNPWGGVFDSQGRYIFVDQKVEIGTGTIGTNQLIRMTPGSPGPQFEILATQTQLAVHVPELAGSGPIYPGLASVDVLSDDSIVLIFSGTSLHKLLKVVPGNPPQITVIASITGAGTISPSVGPMAVDRSQTPNVIYMYYTRETQKGFYSVAADQTNTEPTLWKSPENAPYNPLDFAVDDNGDILYWGGNDMGQLFRIDCVTKNETPLLSETFYERFGYLYMYNLCMDINRRTGDIISIYIADVPYPDTQSRYNVCKVKKNPNGSYANGEVLIIEEQVFGDEDVSPWYIEGRYLISFGCGISISPSGETFFVSNGEPDYKMGYIPYRGIDCILKIGTEGVLGVTPSHWRHYE